MAIDPEALFRQLTALAAERPNLRAVTSKLSIPEDSHKWLGRFHALLEASGMTGEAMELRVQTSMLVKTRATAGSEEIVAILNRALAHAELKAPASSQGSFIAAGDEFQAFAKLAKVLEEAEYDALIVDPYMDEVALTDFASLAREGVSLRLLAADGRAKPTLEPAAARWISQYGTARPLEVRLADPNSMHDRLILVDGRRAWLVTQSLKDFAKRSHGSIALADDEAAAMKIAAYGEIWKGSKKLA